MIKKSLFVLISIMCFSAYAEISIGGDVHTSLISDRNVNEQNDVEHKSTEWVFGLIPRIIIAPRMSRLEIVPSAGFEVRIGSEETETNQGTAGERDWTHFGGGAGLGVFVRVVEGKVLRLSLGPEGAFWVYSPDGDDNNDLTVQGGIPVNLDFLLTDNFFIRTSARVVGASYYRDNQNDNQYDSRITFFDIHSTWIPTLGFYVTF